MNDNNESFVPKEKKLPTLDDLRTEVDGDVFEQHKKHLETLPEELQLELKKLETLENSTERVEKFATIMDTYGLDSLLGLFNVVGDGASGALASLYLMLETYKTDGGMMDYAKIIAYQGFDFAIGSVPVLGGFADYFSHASHYSAKDFQKRRNSLVKKLREKMEVAGVEPEVIEKHLESIYKVPADVSTLKEPGIEEMPQAA
ncbi:hypothetical protein COB57_00165 [Candidatus Peregrinibacteria bacterium]|nr:MAG: hypothetical protein COB57_00165 [Candidatus Peregrinibacteria bacterium]